VVDKHDTGRMYVPRLVQLRAGPKAAEEAETQTGAGDYVDGPILELEACVVPGSGQVSDAHAPAGYDDDVISHHVTLCPCADPLLVQCELYS
jgi:hypothetical protein